MVQPRNRDGATGASGAALAPGQFDPGVAEGLTLVKSGEERRWVRWVGLHERPGDINARGPGYGVYQSSRSPG